MPSKILTSRNWFTEVCSEGGSAFSMELVEKLHEEQTPYQHIEIYETRFFGKLMVIDGFVMLTERDNFIYHEMMSHTVLFSHPQPTDVLVIGGGDCGTLREVLRHRSVHSLVQVEIDERVTRLSERYFPELCVANNDSRARFHFGDGIAWVHDAEDGSYDVIIVDSTDPIGPAEGLFAEPFYRDCRRVLGRDGVLIQQSESPLYHLELLAGMRAAMKAAEFECVRTLQFPQCSYPSGWWTATMAGCGDITARFRERDVRDRGFDTRYYNADIHRASFALPEFLKSRFEVEE